MPGTFFGINIGQSGLAAAQIGQDVTGQNIANANTPGYSVQTLDQAASDAYTQADRVSTLTPGLIGSGVSVSSIQRASDQFLDTQVRDANSSLQSQTAQSDALKQVDDAFGEPSTTGLNAALTSFFSSFQDVANTPENTGVRAAAVQQGVALARTFQTVQAGLTAATTSLAGQSAIDVKTVNSYGTQIAALNVSIKTSTVKGQAPNDLLDQRGILLDKLSGLTNITTQNNSDGTVNVSIGSTALVLGPDAFSVSLSGLTASGDLTSGTLGGIAQAQTKIAAYQTQLNTAAASVVSQVNAAQANGLDLNGNAGTSFFTATTGSEASTIAVNPDLETNPSHLAAASVPTLSATFASGDGSNAQTIAGLLTKTVTAVGDPLAGQNIQGYYQSTVSSAGSSAASALSSAATAQAASTQLTNQRSSETGVSTDAEMVNMMKYQRAYQASAQYIQIADGMIGTLITNLFSSN
ncbi:MAG: flagellar hook-associated protein FlgK [Janthinobacterium lividum]